MPEKFDILILGAGLGGLESAVILARKGFRVGLLEKNKHIGGTLQNFRLGDCSYSAGMHYLGSLDEGQVLHKIFKYLRIYEGLKVKRMGDEVFDRFSIAGQTIDYPIGWDRFRNRMFDYFPNEKHAINAYIELIRTVTESQEIYNLREPENADLRTNPYLKTGIYDAVRSLTPNTDLQNALCALNFVYAGDRQSSSLYTHALINNYYIQSAYRLIGGSSQLAELLKDQIIAYGGEIITGQDVKQFVFDQDQLTGVETKAGRHFYANRIISNIHPSATMEMVPEGKVRKSYRSRISTLQNTISVFGLHLRMKPDVFPYLPYNYTFFKNNDVWAATRYAESEWPGFYFLYTPASTGQGNYTRCLSIYAYMTFDEVGKWASKPIGERGEDYESWKEEKAEILISQATSQFPMLKDNVEDWIAATPLTYRDYIGTPEGAMYGTLRDYHNPMASYVFPRSKIPNLYFTGQNIHLHGMLGVSISALMTCGEIVGLQNIIREINAE